MGLFDEFGGIEGQAGQHAALLGEVTGLVTQSGGVNGLVQQFEQQGLGHLVSGWSGGGTNTPLSADQIVQGIGQDKITAIASKLGLSEAQVTEGISKLLPLVVGTPPNAAAPSQWWRLISQGKFPAACGVQ